MLSASQAWHSAFSTDQSTVRGGPSWAVGSYVEVVLEAKDAQGAFYVAINTTIQSTE